jgi:hypothetical protein
MLKVYKFLSEGYPEYKLAKFRAEWNELSDKSKTQLRDGIEDGTLNY